MVKLVVNFATLKSMIHCVVIWESTYSVHSPVAGGRHIVFRTTLAHDFPVAVFADYFCAATLAARSLELDARARGGFPHAVRPARHGSCPSLSPCRLRRPLFLLFPLPRSSGQTPCMSDRGGKATALDVRFAVIICVGLMCATGLYKSSGCIITHSCSTTRQCEFLRCATFELIRVYLARA